MEDQLNIILSGKFHSWNEETLCKFLDEGNIPIYWKDFFENENVLNMLTYISEYLHERSTKNITIYPPIHNVFRAFYMTIPSNIRVVILGMDPYHNGAANGLAFSVKTSQDGPINPSLQNIYREMENCNIKPLNKTGDLSHLPEQGILLYNTALTVEKGNAGSHIEIWADFTKELITYIDGLDTAKEIDWLLFGNDAIDFAPMIKNGTKILTTHPSPYSANKSSSRAPAFIGSKVFNKLRNKNIKW